MKKDRKQFFIVKKETPKAQVEQLCARAFPLLGSKSAVRKALAGGRLYCNGRPLRPGRPLRAGDKLELRGSGVRKARKFEQDIPVVYQDDYLLVVNKPAGIASNGDRIKTVENALAGQVQPPDLPDALPHPVAAHRLDLPTQGLLMLARSKQTLRALGKAFQHNKVSKEYHAVVHGKPPASGSIDTPLQGKEALTHFETIRSVPSRVFGQLSLLRLRPVTGRTHQLRLHLQQQGHLIVGDKMYAEQQKTILGKGLFLCACQLHFEHPFLQKKIKATIETPPKFIKLLDREEERYRK